MRKKDVFDEIEEYEKSKNQNSNEYYSVRSRSGDQARSSRVITKAMLLADLLGILGIILALKMAVKPLLIFVLCAGVLFFVYGVYALVSCKLPRSNLTPFTLEFVGITMAVMTALLLYSEINPDCGFNRENIDSLYLYSLFIVLGLCLLVFPMTSHWQAFNLFTQPVNALCVYVDVDYSSDHNDPHRKTKTYCPTWEYNYGGQVYKQAESVYTNIGVPKVGEERTIMINPNNPNEIFRNNKSANVFVYVIGFLFVAFPLLTLIK